MIEQVRIENFRCLRDVTIDLTPLTVLVGPNASGKSAVLRALRPGGFVLEDRSQQQDCQIKVDARAGSRPSFERSFSSRAGQGSMPRVQHLQLDLRWLRQPNAAASAASLTPEGGNLTNVFETLPRPTQDSVARELCRLVPTLADVHTRGAEQPGQKRLVFQDRWNRDLWYRPEAISDGTILLLAFLVLQQARARRSI